MRYVAAILIASMLILTVAFYDTLNGLLWYGGLVVIISIALSSIGFAVYYALIARERILTARLDRKRAQYVSFQDGFGMLHLLNLLTEKVENLSTYPGSHHNGTWEDPPPAAAAAWFALVGKARADSPVALLPGGIEQGPGPQLDLLTIFTQLTQSYAFIAGQQVGKTYQARRVAQYWISAGCKPVVIGPKWDQGEWEGCELFGGEYNFERVSQGMRIVRQLATDRHANKGLSHKQHPVQPVFFDDWTGIRAKLEKEAEDFIIEATTLYASVNIILYFILHLDTANAWGVGKVGAALHQNFIKLFIEPGYDGSGRVDRARNVGWLVMPGQAKRDKRRVALFSGTGQVALLPDAIIQPSNEERLITEMAGQDKSYKEISEAVWGTGKYGKFYNEKIDRILGKPLVRS